MKISLVPFANLLCKGMNGSLTVVVEEEAGKTRSMACSLSLDTLSKS